MRKENGTKRTVNIPRVKVTKTKEVWIPTKRRTQPDKELHRKGKTQTLKKEITKETKRNQRTWKKQQRSLQEVPEILESFPKGNKRKKEQGFQEKRQRIQKRGQRIQVEEQRKKRKEHRIWPTQEIETA